MKSILIMVYASLMALGGIPLHAIAQQPYPTKPIRFLVGFLPGGVNDIVARLVAAELPAAFGQQVVVDNRAGANGVVANQLAAQAAPDGHTMVLAATAFVIDIARGAKLPYDSMRDFAPVTLIASSSLVLVVNPSLPVNSVKDLIELARAKPGQLNFGHGGNGNITHIATEMLKSMTGTNMVAVAYKGGGAYLTDVISGQVQFATPTIPPALGLLKSGKLRALGVTGNKQSPVLPGVPTIAESGVPGYEVAAWWAVLVPRNTPIAIINRLNQEIKRTLDTVKIKERLASIGAEPIGNSPKELSDLLRAEANKWQKVIKGSDLKLD